MPFSAAVQDLPHCGRGQRGIDFFFKTSSKSALSSAAAQEKRDILAYFKKVEVTKEQEEQNYMSSLSNNTADTDCSVFSSEEEEIKPGKNGKISRKESVRDFSDNTNANIGTKKSEVVNNRPKKIVVDAIDLTKETEPSENRVKGQNVKACDSSGKSQRSSEAIGNSDDSENIRVKGQNVKACDSRGKSQRSSEAIGNSDDTEDEKTSPVIDVDLISDCEEETVKNTTGSNGCTVESRDCMETESIEATKGKGDVSNTLPSNNVTETKRNVFTLLMSNRGRKSEAGKQSAEDTKPLHEAGEGNGKGQKSGDDCVVVSSSPPPNCEAAKGIVDVNPDASKNSHEVKSKDCDTATDSTMNKTATNSTMNLKPGASKKNSQQVKSGREYEAATDSTMNRTTNSTTNKTPAASKKNSHKIEKSKKEEQSKDGATDLNSSLQDFDLTPRDKPKRKKIRKSTAAKDDNNTDTKSSLVAAVPIDPPDPTPEGKPSTHISFADFMKSASSVTKEVTGEHTVKKMDEVMNNEECKSTVKEMGTSSVTKEVTEEECTVKEMNEECKSTVKEMRASSMAKEVTEGENTVKEMNEGCKSTVKEIEVMKNEECKSKCKVNEQQQTPDSDSTEDDKVCPKADRQQNINTSLACDDLVKKRKLPCASETIDEKLDVQNESKDARTLKTKQAKRKRTRKIIITSSDSEEDFIESKGPGVSKKKEDSKSCDKPPGVANTARISSFFKKISHKEKEEEENKVVFTVQADVHAPLDGNKKAERKPGSPVHTQASGESDVTSTTTNGAAPTADSTKKNTKRTKKNMRNNCNLDELNKIELLEQIPPSKPLSKKVLNKVCVEEKVCDVEEIRHPVKAEVCKAVKADDKVTVASKKGQIINRRSLSRRKINLKATRGAGKKFLRRRKAQVISSDEESADEIFLRKKNKPVESDNDVMVTSSSSSISTVSSEDGGEGKAPSARQSSPEASEDDKENVAHYTSQLVRQPGKLSLRIRRVHPPKETSGKVKLKPSKANKNTGTLKKLKGAKSMLKKRKLRNSPKHKSRKGEADRDSADADGTPPAEQEVTTLDDETDDSSGKQTSKKKTRRAKVKQTLLKPLMPKASTRGRLGKKDAGVSRGESGGEEQAGTQRRTLRRAAAAAKKYIEEATIDDDDDKPKKADKNPKKLVSNKGMKLAPIFCKRATSPGVELLRVVPLSPSKLKARQDFLTSSVSEDIRKQLAVEKSGEDESLAWPPFPALSHVQQREEGEGGAPWNLEDPEIPLKETPSFSPSLESLAFTLDQKGITTTKALHSKPSYHVPRLELGDIVLSLSCMKSKYPDFPVYEVFKAYYDLKKEAVETYRKEVQKEQTVVHLDDDDDDDDVGRSGKRRKRKRKNKLSSLSRGKRRKLGSVKETVEEPPQNQVEEVPSVWHERTPHIWTQTFMPQNAKQVIGNTENVMKLKLWLQEWKSNPQIKPRKRKKKASKKDDFMVSDDSSLGSEGVDFTSTYLLCGPPGAGKTAAVYALASELGYKVLEVNASSRRPGRQVMSQLAEATQSHSVSNASAAAQPSGAFSALFAAKTSSNASKKENSQTGDTSKHDRDSNKMKGVSLVLFEDIDIVFEEWDEGFMSTVNTLMATTKRPIILTATHASPAILAQVKESFEVMEFVLPQQKLTAQHLQLVALANGCHVCLQDAEWLVHHNKGDVRKSMLDLQLLSQSGSSHDLCDCAVSKDAMSNTEDSWKTIFPEVKTIARKKPNQITFYKVGLRKRLYAETTLNLSIPRSDSEYLCSDGGISWTDIESDINCILPFPLSEREKSVLRYPLQPNDPLLKRSTLWQYESLISLNDGEETVPTPVTERPKHKVKPSDPPHVQKASQCCLKSLATMYDSLAHLDILSSSQIRTHEAEIKDIGWWVKQPTAGLSDTPSLSHPYWTPHSNGDIIEELAENAVTCCVGEVVSALEGVTAKDWPQLCLPRHRRGDSHDCIVHSCNYESERVEKRNVMSRLFDNLPAVGVVSRGAGLDYLPALRSLAREDELGAALGRGRRGRRFLSHFLQMGWSVAPEERISLANSLIT